MSIDGNIEVCFDGHSNNLTAFYTSYRYLIINDDRILYSKKLGRNNNNSNNGN